jgi:flagellin-like hook-associated protein FlgL
LGKPIAADDDRILNDQATSTATTTVTTFLAQPDVPRNITVTAGGTAGDIKTGTVVVTGTNVEGAAISENFVFADDTTGAQTGSKAFKTVTSILFPVQDGTGATYDVGVGSKLGIGMRNIASMPIEVMVNTAGTETIEAASASAFSTSAVESNTVTTTTAMTGAIGFRVYVLNYKWAINPDNSTPDYGV